MRGRGRYPAYIAAVGLAAVLALTGCTGQTPRPSTGTVTAAVSERFTSVNPSTSYGDTTTNGDVAALTRTGFGYYDAAYRLVRDESFGTARVVSRAPFTVRYTVKEGVTWSDGAPIDGRDLLLSWAAQSGAVNTKGFDPSRYVDSATGRLSGVPSGTVWFDGADAGLRLSARTPRLRDDGRSLDVTYSAAFPDWPIALEPTLPAHVVASVALGGDSSVGARKADVAEAIQKRSSTLPAIARAWNDAGNLAAMPKDPAVLTASGPYRVSAIGNDSVAVSANLRYRGNRTPTYRRIVLRTVADPLEQVKLLRAGDIDIATPQPTADVVKALIDLPDARTTVGAQGLFEHLDLQVQGSASGTFANPLVRRAFLHVVPRTQIVRQIVAPVYADARPLQSFTLPPGGEDYARSARGNGSRGYEDVDVDAAKTLLAQAGVSSPRVCILYDPGSPRRQTEFSLIQQTAAQAGFQVSDCSSPDWKDLLGVPGSYDAALFAWDTTQIGTAAIGQVYRSGASLTNLTGYSNPDVDALVDRLSTADADEQRDILVKIDKLLWADAYGAPLFQYPAVSSVSRSVKNVSLSPLERGVFWNAWQWAPRTSG